MIFSIESEAEEEPQQVEAETAWEAAGIWAAQQAGFDCDEMCFDPFSFTVDGVVFRAEVISVSRSGGKVQVTQGKETKLFDQDGWLED